MTQRLIVEGNDAIAIGAICKKRGLKNPKGYESDDKYKAEFVKSANGNRDKLKIALKEELESPDVTNIGVILDANDVGVDGRITSMKSVIEETLKVTLGASISKNGFCNKIGDLTIGIWAMPNNKENGYLENFICSMIPKEEAALWEFVNEKVDELMGKKLHKFSDVKKQKALIHTYLAWKEKPGLPMGTAVSSNYIDAMSPAANSFIDWFREVFVLSE